MPFVKEVGDLSRLDPPQITLLSLGFCGPKALQTQTTVLRKDMKKKDMKKATKGLNSLEYLISDFSATSQDELLNL